MYEFDDVTFAQELKVITNVELRDLGKKMVLVIHYLDSFNGKV